MSDIPYDVTPTQVRDGYDITITARDGHRIYPTAEVVGNGRSCTIHVRDYAMPRIGQRICLRKMLVKVADTRFDHEGNLQVLDEDTKAWIPYDA